MPTIAPTKAPTRSPVGSPAPATLTSGVVFSGITAADFGADEELSFKQGLLLTLGDLIDSIDDIIDVSATDYVRRRQRQRALLASSAVQIEFTIVVDLEDGDTDALVDDFIGIMDASLNDGSLQSNIITGAGASSALASAVVDVDATETLVASASSTMIVTSPTAAPASIAPTALANKKKGSSLPVIVPVIVLVVLIILAVVVGVGFALKKNPNAKMKEADAPAPVQAAAEVEFSTAVVEQRPEVVAVQEINLGEMPPPQDQSVSTKTHDEVELQSNMCCVLEI